MSSNEDSFTLNDVEMSVITDKKKAIEAVSFNGYELENVSENLQDDFEVVITAVTEAGGAIFHASPNMQNNLHVAVTAIKNMFESISSVSPELIEKHEGLKFLASFSDDDQREAACNAYLQEHEKEFDKQKVKGSEANPPSPRFFGAQLSSPEATTPLSSPRYQY